MKWISYFSICSFLRHRKETHFLFLFDIFFLCLFLYSSNKQQKVFFPFVGNTVENVFFSMLLNCSKERKKIHNFSVDSKCFSFYLFISFLSFASFYTLTRTVWFNFLCGSFGLLQFCRKWHRLCVNKCTDHGFGWWWNNYCVKGGD